VGLLVVGSATAGPNLPGSWLPQAAKFSANAPGGTTGYTAVQDYLFTSQPLAAGIVGAHQIGIEVQNAVSTTVINATALSVGIEMSGRGAVTNMQGISVAAYLSDAGGTGQRVANLIMLGCDGPDILSGSGVIDTVYQFKSDDLDFGTDRYNMFLGGCVSLNSPAHCYGLWIDPVGGGSSANYAIYTNAGAVRFGDTVAIAQTGDVMYLNVDRSASTPVAVVFLGTAGANDARIQSNNDSSLGFPNGGVTVGAPTGGNKGNGTINVATNIFRNGGAYTNPDYVFEIAYVGRARSPVARGYSCVPTLAEVEAYAREHYSLPGRDDTEGLFDRSQWVEEKIEEMYLSLFDHDRRLRALEKGPP
jgi:hypothetical protein